MNKVTVRRGGVEVLDIVREDGLMVEVEKRRMCGGFRVEPWGRLVEGRWAMARGDGGGVGWSLGYLHVENLFLKCVT